MTPAVRVLEAAKVTFTLHEYEHSSDADSFGLEAASKLGVSPDRVFKTLIAQVDGRDLVAAIVPVDAKVDLKKLAAAVGGKRAEMAQPQAAERATGYVVGGISPLGGKKRLKTVIDDRAAQQQTILVSAGRRGLQIELGPSELVRLTDAKLAAVSVK